MSTIGDTAVDVLRYYVNPGWVAKHYGVSTLQVYRAIRAGKLLAFKVGGGTLVLDTRMLPSRFPR